MKKIIAVLFVCILCAGLAACGEKKPQADLDGIKSAVDKLSSSINSTTDKLNSELDESLYSSPGDVESSVDSSVDTSTTLKFNSIEEYLEYPDVKKSLDDAIEQIKAYANVLTFNYRVDGNQLHYDYTYVNQISADALDTTKSTLEKSVDSSASQYEGLVKEMKQYINISNPELVLSYLNADGSVIYSKTFS